MICCKCLALATENRNVLRSTHHIHPNNIQHGLGSPWQGGARNIPSLNSPPAPEIWSTSSKASRLPQKQILPRSAHCMPSAVHRVHRTIAFIHTVYIYIVWFLCLPGPFVALLPFSFVIGGLMGVTINWNSQNAFGMPFVCVILASQMPSSKASLIQGQQVDGIQQFSLRTISTRMHQSNHIKPQ